MMLIGPLVKRPSAFGLSVFTSYEGDYDTSLQAHFTDSRTAPEVDINPPPPIVHTYHATTNKSAPSNPNKSEGWSTDANYYDNY